MSDLFSSTMSMTEMLNDWLIAKKKEKEAADYRRKIEDQLTTALNLEQKEGSDTIKQDGYKIKVTQRYNRKIDADKLQEIAAEHGLSEHLGALFRWKPEINAAAWKSTDAQITDPLLTAITTTPGRPSYSIEAIEE